MSSTASPKRSPIAATLQEIRYELNKTATIRALAGGTELAQWRINVTPDKPPQISLSRPPELTPRGSLKLTYKAEDDYGVTSAKVNLEKAKAPPPDPAKDWAKPEPLSGPRPPLQRPPELPLKLTKPNAKSVDGRTYFDFASHPWAGHKVIMTLEATDVAGQTGRSVSFEMILPERNFTKPLARAVVEQRRKLMDDPRYRGSVMKALDALTLEPDGFIDDLKIYLGLRTRLSPARAGSHARRHEERRRSDVADRAPDRGRQPVGRRARAQGCAGQAFKGARGRGFGRRDQAAHAGAEAGLQRVHEAARAAERAGAAARGQRPAEPGARPGRSRAHDAQSRGHGQERLARAGPADAVGDAGSDGAPAIQPAGSGAAAAQSGNAADDGRAREHGRRPAEAARRYVQREPRR